MHGAAMRRAQQFFEHGRLYDAMAGRGFAGLYRAAVDDVLLSEPPHGAAILDAGCGPGRLAVDIAQRRADLSVQGVDLAAGAIEVAVSRADRAGLADRVRFLAADLADLPFPDDTFDLIITTVSYHHWEKVDAIVHELARVLKSSGALWLYDLRPAPMRPFLDAVAHAMPERTVHSSLVRTGPFPIALYRRVRVSRAG